MCMKFHIKTIIFAFNISDKFVLGMYNFEWNILY